MPVYVYLLTPFLDYKVQDYGLGCQYRSHAIRASFKAARR